MGRVDGFLVSKVLFPLPPWGLPTQFIGCESLLYIKLVADGFRELCNARNGQKTDGGVSVSTVI